MMQGTFRLFWQVVGEGIPWKTFLTEAEAKAEASRLASTNPDRTFYVMVAESACRKSEIEWLQPDKDAPG